MEVYLPWNNDPTKQLRLRRRCFQSSLTHRWSEIFLASRHQFHTSILLSNWILNNQQMSIWNLGSDAYCEYKSCYFKVVTLSIRNLVRVRLPYLLFIRRLRYNSFTTCHVRSIHINYAKIYLRKTFYALPEGVFGETDNMQTHCLVCSRNNFKY
jgi:hypothetical protein